jgi:hypothetical protein
LNNSRDVMYEKNMKSHFKIIRYIMVCGKLVAMLLFLFINEFVFIS